MDSWHIEELNRKHCLSDGWMVMMKMMKMRRKKEGESEVRKRLFTKYVIGSRINSEKSTLNTKSRDHKSPCSLGVFPNTKQHTINHPNAPYDLHCITNPAVLWHTVFQDQGRLCGP
jgi:hypothetical protein